MEKVKEIVESVAEEAKEEVKAKVKKVTRKKAPQVEEVKAEPKSEVQEIDIFMVEEAEAGEAPKEAEPTEEEVKADEKPFTEDEPISEETKAKIDSLEKEHEEIKEKPEAKPQKVEAPKAKTAAIVRPKKLDDFGGFKTKEVERDSKPKVAVDRKAVEKYEKLRKDNEVIWAKVVGSEEDKSRKNGLGAVCDLGDGLRAIIPESLYFMPDTQFDEKYEEQNDDEKVRIRKKFISYQIGAIVCFTVFSVSIDKEKGLTIFGNRVDAMNKLQDFYFTHINYPQTESNTIAVGDVTKARILTVRSHKLFVECCGVETFIPTYYLSNETIVNCKDYYKPGDVIEVKIRKLYTEPKNYIAVAARDRISQEKIKQIVKGSTYLGTVDRVDAKKGTISVRLANGLNVSILKDKVITVDPKALAQGDKVIVEILKVLDNFALGFVITKC